ncbi:hypothetical protein E2P81_ATG01809 [Venturia nashicola]|uniref:Uncharacterized protein n=1 Tax=Venturia nashicola TaxID=86259 RepID=A0A4Z1PK19_9PEZI|nr:hypothetical protein E6O75_ATG01856 [Venturia nashicola]TLD35506.1 hypothetical protein E2P81_ATG01809 [Venturia nashicola]
MDSIWGDPWADDAKPNLPEPKDSEPVEVTAFEPVKPQTTLVSGGFEDEAGWGDFEESTGFGTDGTEGNGNQESGWSAGERHEDEKDLTTRLAPKTPFIHTNGSGIISPGWGDSQTLKSTPEPPSKAKHNGDISEIPPSPVWESMRSSISSITYAPRSLHVKEPDLHLRNTEPDDHVVSATPPRPSTSSTTKTAVSTDSNAFSESRASPTHYDAPRWEREPLHSDATDGFDISLDSIRTSFEEAYVASKQVEEPALHVKNIEEGSAAVNGSSRNIVHADEEHESMQEEKPQAGTDLDDLRATVKAPRFNTNLNLVKDIFKSSISSENYEEANDEVIDSTSTRKAWYRLTRPQTMQEFNTGATDDNYVRVSWMKSHVRAETLKVATRWAAEDRIYGRVVLGGKPGAATFGWDMPSDGSIVPPRPMSMISSLPQREQGGKHHASHQRQSSMPHPSSRTNSSPVAQFGWSTSPTSSSNGVIASLEDVLESRAMPAASEPHIRVGRQWQAEQVSVPATAKSPLPVTSSLDEMKTASPSEPGLQKQHGLDSPGLHKRDTTKADLNASLEDDDDEWGELVKSPSEPLHPMVSPSMSASVVEQKSVSVDEHVPIISTRRKPTPIIAPPEVQNSPDSMLSPARKSAMEAARATRFLNSQPNRSGSPIMRDSESRSSASGPRRLFPSPSPSTITSLNIVRSPSPDGLTKSATGVVPIASCSFLEADLSFFETPAHQPTLPHPTRDVSAPVQLSAIEEEHAQTIVRKIPNLSFMLR